MSKKPGKESGKTLKKSKKEVAEEALQAAERTRIASEHSKWAQIGLLCADENRSNVLADHKKHEQADNASRLLTEATESELRKQASLGLLASAYQRKQASQESDNLTCCSSLPSAESERDINQYLEALRCSIATNFGISILSIDRALEIVDELIELWGKLVSLQVSACEGRDVKRVEWAKRLQSRLRESAEQLIDEATGHTLRNSGNLGLNPRQEFQANWPSIGIWGLLSLKGFRAKVVDFPSLGVTLEIPKSVAMHCPGHMLAFRVIGMHSEFFYKNIEISSRRPVGAQLLRIEVLSIPPPPRESGTWKFQLIDERTKQLLRLEYPNKENVENGGAWQPLRVEWKLKGQISARLKSENLTVSRMTVSGWNSEGISEISFSDSGVSFQSLYLGVFAVTIDPSIYHPLISWTLLPKQHLMTELTIDNHMGKICFQIGSSGIRCSDFDGWKSPGEMLLALESRGIFLASKVNSGAANFLASEISEISSFYDVVFKEGTVSVHENHRFEQPLWDDEDWLAAFKIVSYFEDGIEVQDIRHASLPVALDKIWKGTLQRSTITLENVLFAENVKLAIELFGLLT